MEEIAIYHDFLGHAYHRRFVVVTDMHDGDLITDGIYEDYHTAVGHVMAYIWEFSDSYKNDGDKFEISLPDYRDNGEYITIKFQSHNWEKPREEICMILYSDDRTPKQDRKKESTT